MDHVNGINGKSRIVINDEFGLCDKAGPSLFHVLTLDT